MEDIGSHANLLVRAALEALLANPGVRSDVAGRVERIKAAALMECAEKGYGNLTIADVASRAKVSTATIYQDYKDRDALLVEAMEMLFAIMAGDVIELPQTDDPLEQVEQLLLAHGQVYTEPLASWMFRLHVHLAWSGHTHLHAIGQRIFEGIDAFWEGYLGSLMGAGYLAPVDCKQLTVLLLGPVERATIISLLACGETEADRPALADVARHGAETLFSIWGTPAFWERNTRPGLAPVSGVAAAIASLDVTAATSAIEPLPTPEQRLVTALKTGRAALEAQGRRERILLAAVVECQERGYNAASVMEVAARARVSTATLYKSFEDKADLFSTCLEYEVALRPRFEARLPDGATGLKPALVGALLAITQAECDSRWLWVHKLIMASQISGTGRVVAIARAVRADYEAGLAALLRSQADWADSEAATVSLAVNFLLGPLERTGPLSLILFGRATIDHARLAQLASLAVCLVLPPQQLRRAAA